MDKGWGGGRCQKKKRRKTNDIIPKIIQGKELSRNNEEGMEFRGVICNICYCCGPFTDSKIQSFTALNVQNNSQVAQVSSSQVF